MGLTISTNLPAMTARRDITDAYDRTTRIMRQLASGDRIVEPGDDEAGFATSEELRNQIASLKKAQQNTQGATGLVQVAEGALNEQGNILLRLRELAVQSSSDTVSSEERDYLNTEFQQLLSETDRVAQSTRYGQRKLLVGNGEEYQFQVGTGSDPALNAVKFKASSDTRSSALGISGLSVGDRDDARDALDTLDAASQAILQARSGFGALQSRLQIVSSGLDEQTDAAAAARSRISDVDVAQATTDLAIGKVRQDVATAVLAQANASPSRALRLLY